MQFIKSTNWKTVWTSINWNQLYNVHLRSRVSSVNWQLVVADDIREKKIETDSIFVCMALRLTSLDEDHEIWLKKKSSLITKSVVFCHDSIQFDFIMFYLVISLPTPNPAHLFMNEFRKQYFPGLFFLFLKIVHVTYRKTKLKWWLQWVKW